MRTPRRPTTPNQTVASSAANDRADRARRISWLLGLATGPMRLNILLILAESERYATEIGEVLGQHAQPTTSHQLALLRQGGLIDAIR